MIKILTTDEYNVLNKVTAKTKTDCWFVLKQDKAGNDYVWDAEEGKRLALKTGIGLLLEAIDCEETYGSCQLDATEAMVFENLLGKLGLLCVK